MEQSRERKLAQQAAGGDVTAMSDLQTLAVGGNVEAAFLLGYLHDGPEKPGLEGNYGEARAWYEKAAMAGHALAQYCLGNLYDYGDGGYQDDQKARHWYEAAAKQGVRDAQMHFATMLQRGRGGPQSSSSAADWYGKAAALGDVQAATNLGLMHFNTEIENASDAEAFKLFVKAASGMDGLAHLMLGNMILEGRVMRGHFKQAFLHFCIATLLLPAGKNQDVARTEKARLLERHPDFGPRLEKVAQTYVRDGRGQLPFIRE